MWSNDKSKNVKYLSKKTVLNLMRTDNAKTVYILLSCFFLPCFILMLVYSAYSIAPFGDTSVLIMDMSGQCCEFFCGLKNISAQNGGILFSWSKALGGNYAGVFAYYLASPLSLITLFCPNENMPICLAFLTILKIGLCGLTFGILMNYFDKNKSRIIVFSLFYALMSYNIVYSMCLMWLDAVIWLPIIILGIEKIAAGGKPYILFVSYVFLFISSYYIAYMVGVFSCLYVAYVLVRQNNTIKNVFVFLGKFAGSVITAAGVGAWLLLPTAASLFEGKIGKEFVVPENGINYQGKSIISKFFIGTYDSITNYGTPFFYMGAIIFMFFFGYFCIKSISLREKIAMGVITTFIAVSTYYFKLDLMWHVFQKPNWFPYRYFFIFGFIVIFIACKAALKFKEIPCLYYVIFLALASSFYIITYNTGVANVTQKQFSQTLIYLFAVVLLALMLSVLQNKYKIKKFGKNTGFYFLQALLCCSILVISCFELRFNAINLTQGLDKAHRYDSYEKYREYKIHTQNLVNKVEEIAEDEFYRMGTCFQRNFNEPIGVGYYGISHYSSSYNTKLYQFYGSLGIASLDIWGSYAGSTMATDSLFSIKYVMSDPDASRMSDNDNIISWCKVPFGSYTEIYKNETASIYENPYVMPPFFYANKELKEFKLGYGDINNQNQLLNCIFGEEKGNPYFIQYGEVSFESSGYLPGGSYVSVEKDNGIQYMIVVAETGPVYAYLPYNGSKASIMTINSKNDVRLYTSETNCVQFLGNYKKGEIVTIEIIGDIVTNGNAFYSFNEELFAQRVEETRKHSISNIEWASGYLKGKIAAEKDGCVFTSIPYDKSWNVLIDGKKVDTWAVGDALLAFDISAGEHTVILEYNVPGFNVGLTITIISFTCVVAYLVIQWIMKKRKSCEENE